MYDVPTLLALTIAYRAHEGVTDAHGVPYIEHPLAVMRLLEGFPEPELKCVALLHDVLEDSDYTEAMLRDVFSKRVVDAVVALTKHPGQSYEDYKVAVLSNPDAIRVKMADIRHNTDVRRLKGTSDRDMARIKRYYEFYAELAKAVSD